MVSEAAYVAGVHASATWHSIAQRFERRVPSSSAVGAAPRSAPVVKSAPTSASPALYAPVPRAWALSPPRAIAVVARACTAATLVGRRACESAPRPGVTRQLRWVRVNAGSAAKRAAAEGRAASAEAAANNLDMLDSPGIMPMRMDDQRAALLLAAIDDVGEASYTASAVAAGLLETMRALAREESLDGDGDGAVSAALESMAASYGLASAWEGTGEDIVAWLAIETYQDDLESAARRILKDFRRGAWGWLALERPHTE